MPNLGHATVLHEPAPDSRLTFVSSDRSGRRSSILGGSAIVSDVCKVQVDERMA